MSTNEVSLKFRADVAEARAAINSLRQSVTATFTELNNVNLGAFNARTLPTIPPIKIDLDVRPAEAKAEQVKQTFAEIAKSAPVIPVNVDLKQVDAEIRKTQGALDKLWERARVALERDSNRLNDFKESLRIKFDGKVDTEFLTVLRSAQTEAERLQIITERFGPDASKMAKSIQTAALQFEKLQRDGTQSISAIESKVNELEGKLSGLTTAKIKIEADTKEAEIALRKTEQQKGQAEKPIIIRTDPRQAEAKLNELKTDVKDATKAPPPIPVTADTKQATTAVRELKKEVSTAKPNVVTVQANTTQAAHDVSSFRRSVTNDISNLDAVTKGAFQGIRNEVALLANQIPLVGQPLAGITRELFRINGAGVNLSRIFKQAQTDIEKLGTLQPLLQKAFDKAPFTELETTLQRFGIRVRQGLDPIPASTAHLTTLVQEFRKIPDAADRAALAEEIFGKNAAKATRILEDAGVAFQTVENAALSANAGIASFAATIGLTFAALAAVGLVAGLVAVKVSKVGDEIFKASEKTSFGTETISGLRAVVDDAGVSMETTSDAIVRFEANLTRAARGSKTLSAAFRKVGIDAESAVKDPEKAFDTFLRFFQTLPRDADRAGIAMDLFGRAGGDLIPLFDKLGTSLDGAKRNAKEAGQVFSEDAARQAHELQVALHDIGDSAEGLQIAFASGATPAVREFAEAMSRATQNSQGAAAALGSVLGNILAGVGKVLADLRAVIELEFVLPFKQAFDAVVTGGKAAKTAIEGIAIAFREIVRGNFENFVPALRRNFDEASKEVEAFRNRTKERLKDAFQDITGFDVHEVTGPITERVESDRVDAATQPSPLPSVDDTENRVSALRAGLEEAKRLEADANSRAKIAFEERRISLKTLTDAQVNAAKSRVDTERAAVEAEKELQREILSDKSSTVEQKKAADEELVRLDQRIRNAESEFNRAKAEAEANQRKQALEAEKQHGEAILRLKADVDKRTIDLTKQAVELGKATREQGLAIIERVENEAFKREKEFAQQRLRLAGANAEDRKTALDEIARLEERGNALLQEQEQRRTRLLRDEAEKQKVILLSRRQAFLDANQIRDDAGITALRAIGETRVRSQENIENQIIEIERKGLARRAEILRQDTQLAKSILNPDERLKEEERIKNASIVLTEQQKAFEADTERRTFAARQRDIENLRDYSQELERINRQNFDLQNEIGRAEIERLGLLPANRRRVIELTRSLEQDAARERLRQANEELNEQEREAVKRVKGLEDEEKKKLEIEAKFRELRRLLLAQFEQDKTAIEREASAAREREDPASTRSLFGDNFANNLLAIKAAADAADQSISNLRANLLATAQTAADFFAQQSQAAGNFSSIAGGAVQTFTNGLGQLTEAFILTGKTGPAALRKLTAQVLAQVAAQAAVKAIYELAEGFALLFVNPAASTAHFTAAALYGSVAAVAGVAGRAVAGNLFNQPQGQSALPGQNKDTREREPIVQGRPRFEVALQIKHEPGISVEFQEKVTGAFANDFQSNGVTRELTTGGVRT